MESCPTVAIQGKPSEGNLSGVVIVNESDFDPATMTKVGEAQLKTEAAEKVAAEVQTKAEAKVLEEADPKNQPKVVAPWAAKSK